MRAVVVATGHPMPPGESYPAPLFPLVDRPFVQHVVEFLVDRGVTEFDFILHHAPEQIERLLGDGGRWGSRFRFHLARDPARPYRLLRGVGLSGGRGPLLLVHADRLPDVQLAQVPSAPEGAVLFCWRRRGDASNGRAVGGARWTGWAWLSTPCLAGLPGDPDEEGLGAYLASVARRKGAFVKVPEPLSAQSPEALLTAHRRVLAKGFTGLLLTGRETDEGIWMSRNVSLHPTARLIPPVYIGENCRIGAGAQLGPNAAVGRDCVLDARCSVARAAIFPGSYVGEALELADVVVDRNRLINVRVGTAVSVADEFILGDVADSHLREWVSGALSRGIAGALLAFTWPVLLATALCLKLTRKGPVLHRRGVVRLPAPPEEAAWREFHLWSFSPDAAPGGRVRDLLLRFLPALVNAARGELHLVGVPPRTRGEVRALPHDWRALYLRAKAGVVTEASVHCGDDPTPDELYSAEAFYAVTAGVRRDLRLLVGYVGRALNIFRI
jgi:lipopolysaccharide/colanic/teichoic acid biosynthesis glycosyltransferase